jgi:peptidoglycan/xylan/chitin deacetylase (PgdA/CDA1 family)
VEGEVDPYLAGNFSVTYSVSDGAGNKAETVRTIIVTPKAQTQTVVPAGKVIYLTFDDGPGPWTNELLDVLKKYDVKATFFVINSGYPDVLKRIVSEGHAIGVHSVTHDYSTIYESPEAFFDDLLSMQRLIEEYTGVTTTLMRFPGGSSNTVSCFSPGIMTYLTQAVEDMGFQYFDWNVDSNDAGGARKAETVFKNVCQGVQRQRISVVLQHDVKDFSVQAVERIIQWGLENGYTFLPLSPDSPGAHHGVNN